MWPSGWFKLSSRGLKRPISCSCIEKMGKRHETRISLNCTTSTLWSRRVRRVLLSNTWTLKSWDWIPLRTEYACLRLCVCLLSCVGKGSETGGSPVQAVLPYVHKMLRSLRSGSQMSSCATLTPTTPILRYVLQINKISHFRTYQFTEHDIPWKSSYLNAYNI
jgi:hypothetical protein